MTGTNASIICQIFMRILLGALALAVNFTRRKLSPFTDRIHTRQILSSIGWLYIRFI